MADESNTFLRVTFRGGRFDRHAMPVDVLAELTSLQKALFELASAEYRRRHPEAKRRPRGFAEQARLYLTETEHNCFTASIARDAEPTLPGIDPETLDVFAHARSSLFEAFQGEGPTTTARSVLKVLARVGDRLGEGEEIELRSRKGDAPVRVDHASRARIAATLREPLEQVEDLEGEVEKVDDLNHIVELRTRDRRVVRVPFDSTQRPDVLDALLLRPALRVRVRARVREGTPSTATMVDEFDVVDHERRGDIENLWRRLDELAALEGGWLDGAGLAPEAGVVARVREVLAKLLAEHDVPRPKVFPLEEGDLQAEWMFGLVSADVCFKQDGSILCSAVHAHDDKTLDAAFEEAEVTRHDASKLAAWIAEARAL